MLLKHLETANPSLDHQQRHEVNQEILKWLMQMNPNDESDGETHDLDQVDAEAISKLLILTADLEFSLPQLK